MKTVKIYTKVYPRSLKMEEGHFKALVCFTKKSGEIEKEVVVRKGNRHNI